MSRHRFEVATWVGQSDVATHFWCRDMMLAALWPFGVTSWALGRDRGRRSCARDQGRMRARPACYARSSAQDSKQCARDLGSRCAHCAHNPVLRQCIV